MSHSICICDDDEALSSLLAQDLRSAGFHVTPTATNPAEALHIIRTYNPDILLLDLRMPADNGLQLLSRLGMLDLLATIRVVMLTGEEDIFYMDKAKRLGASGYITKPYDRAKLISKLTRLKADPTLSWVDDISCLCSAHAVSERNRSSDIEVQSLPDAPPVRVLSVEDNPANQELISLFLGGGAYVVDQAFNGREAIERVAKERYDVILTDLRLPDVDGLEVIQSVRNSRGEEASLPIVVLSADTLPRHVAAARAAGADDFLSKPYSAKALRQSINRVLRQSSSLAPLAESSTVADVARNYGRMSVERLLRSLEHQLVGLDADPHSRNAIEFAAHSIKGAAGTLGFSRLATSCHALQAACRSGSGFNERLSEARQACAYARHEISHYLSSAS